MLFRSGELLIILIVGLLFFGAERIPELARSLGRSVNAFKQGLKEGMEEEPKGSKEKKALAEEKKPD